MGSIITEKEFIEKARETHGDRYDYSKVNFINKSTKVCIICSEHGDFWQMPRQHLKGCGCERCSGKKITTEDFISKSNKIHNGKYDYSKTEYTGNLNKLCITCSEHGDFYQTPHEHLEGCGCPKCFRQSSKTENEILEFIKNNTNLEVEHGNREVIKPYEIDIYIPSLKIGIEYNGLYWHSEEQGKDKDYHLRKLELCKKKGIRLLQIYEDEYVNHEEIVNNKVLHILKEQKNLLKISGRKCIIKEIGVDITKEFLNKYHIQGFVGSTIYLGAYHDNNLIAVMSFKKMVNNTNNWELTRFASDYHFICQGVGSKLFKYFVKNYNPEEVKSFADRRWTVDEENNIYIQLGFKFNCYTRPDYSYFKPSDGCIRQHKFNFRKQKLNKKYGLPLSMTESEMVSELGYEKIWNCGLIKYVWKKQR